MSTINPTEIAEQTGLDVDDVNAVLSHLVPSWLFARYIDNDMDDLDYLHLRDEREYALRTDGGKVELKPNYGYLGGQG